MWAWLKPHPQLLAEGAAIAVALHSPYTIAAAAATAALVAAATAAAVTAGGPLLLPGRRPHFCYQTAVNESQKCIFFLRRALPRTPSQAELDMSAIFTPLMSGQTPKF